MHIGTCGLVGDRVKTGDIVLSMGSFKDAALRCSLRPISQIDPVAHPDSELTAAIESQLIAAGLPRSTARLYDSNFLLPARGADPRPDHRGCVPSGPPVGYFEMEQASFLQTCTLMKKRAASVVVGTDRYS